MLLLGSGFAIRLEPVKHVERLPEAQMFDSLQEVQYVAVRAAAVAVEGFRLGVNRELRRAAHWSLRSTSVLSTLALSVLGKERESGKSSGF